jgi:hypothetical protein
MSLKHWIVRFLLFFVVAFAVLLVVKVLKGNQVSAAVAYGLSWAALSASVFTAIGYARYRRSPACMTKRSSGRSVSDRADP